MRPRRALIGAGGGLLVGSAMANNSAGAAAVTCKTATIPSYACTPKANRCRWPYGYGGGHLAGAADYYPAAPAEGVPPDYVPR